MIVRRGSRGTTAKSVARAARATAVVWAASYDRAARERDERFQSELEEAGLRATIVHDVPAIAPEETAAFREDERGYRAFAPYYALWRTLPIPVYEAPLLVRFAASDVETEALPVATDFGGIDAQDSGGERDAAAALHVFLDRRGLDYASAMNVPAQNATSRLSAQLSFGTISARSILHAAARRIDDAFLLSEERASLRLYVRSIALRDFFFQLAWYAPQTQDEPLQEKMRGFTFARTHGALGAWRSGRTGYPLVDAGVRQLHASGWMHPHVRSVAASFLVFDLGIDWRVGRDEWDRWLIEDDPALATGNWQWIAGVGADMAQYPRIYNPQKQRVRFDPAGTYVKQYVPELAHVPIDAWQTPNNENPQLSLPLFADNQYPQPIVNHETAAQEFLTRYRQHQSPSPLT